jgi:hypothetical protein
MIKTLRTIVAGTLMIGTLCIAQSNASAAPSCPSNPNTTLSDFPAFSYELTSSHRAQLDAVAKKVYDLTKSGKPVRKIRIVGHAAIWGQSNYQQTSEYRAAVVQAELTSRFANLGINYSKTQITTEGMSTSCPVATNSTQVGRAANRRVELWITAAAPPPPPPPPPPPAKKKTLTELLKGLQRSSNPTTSCIAGKLLNPSTNDNFLPVQGLHDMMRENNEKKYYDYYKHEVDLGPHLDRALKRIRDTQTNETDEARFQKIFQNNQDQLIDGVRALWGLHCREKRAKVLRNYIIDRTKRSRSLYSCPVIKQLVEESTKHMCTA